MRLDKYVTYAGLTRSEASSAIRSGRVAVNDTIIKNPAEKVESNVTLDGNVIDGSEYIYLLLNKPSGYVCENNRPDSVFGLVPEKYSHRKLSVCGRLDKDTEGFLLITDDGDFVHRIISPAKHLPKTYLVRSANPLSDSDITKLKSGIVIADNERCKPCECVRADNPNEYLLTITEGMYHQIKRMLNAVGNEVVYLKRIKTGGLSLPEGLKTGEILRLSDGDVLRIFTP
ncbi:MAG: rRNA pseudouridine synthase [Ruminococcus sp.]|jgi:16S rRNA pseudouridine516 synthase|nr:rRNA pseudouridine synthase [Ruminococcus sp.]